MLQMLNPTLPPLCNGFDLLIKQHVSHSAQITLSSAASWLFQNYKSVKTLHLEEISQAAYILKAKKFVEPPFQSKKIAEKVHKSGRKRFATNARKSSLQNFTPKSA